MTFEPERIERSKSEEGLLIMMLFIVGSGASVLFSSSYHFGRVVFGDPYFFLKRQILWISVGLILVFIIQKVPFELIKRAVPALILLSLLLNGLTYLPGIGRESGGARRWIDIFGLSLQPSEVARVSIIFYLARMLEKNKEKMRTHFSSLFPPLIVVSAFVIIIFFQNDFSSAIFVLFLTVCLFFIAGVRLSHLAALLGGCLLLGTSMVVAKPYRLMRVVSWLDPSADPVASGYQILAAKRALQEGGFWGRGLGRGIMKLGGVPHAHSDFTVAVIGEEAGFLGIAFLLVLFIIFIIKGIRISRNSCSLFGRYLAFGLTIDVFYHVLINMSVVAGLLPATGIPLPFFSVGGSVTVMTMTIFGVLHKISR